MTMSGEQFWKTVVAGLIATYVMTMTGFWQSGLGLAALDVGADDHGQHDGGPSRCTLHTRGG